MTRPYGPFGLTLSLAVILLLTAIFFAAPIVTAALLDRIFHGGAGLRAAIGALRSDIADGRSASWQLPLFLAGFYLYVAMIAATIVVAVFRGRAHWRDLVALKPWRLRSAGRSYWGLVGAGVVYGLAASVALGFFSPSTADLSSFPRRGLALVAAYGLVGVAAPFAEELLFRGMDLYQLTRAPDVLAHQYRKRRGVRARSLGTHAYLCAGGFSIRADARRSARTERLNGRERNLSCDLQFRCTHGRDSQRRMSPAAPSNKARMIAMQIHPEMQYLDLMRRLIDDGDKRVDRTGVGAASLFGEMLKFDLADGLPLLTTKRVYWKLAVKEMLWFLAGGTNIRPLVEQGVGIWTDWPLAAYRKETGETVDQHEFERRVLADDAFAARWGELGPIYGKQWRRWSSGDGREYDQIAQLISDIRVMPSSRRLLFTAWNVAELSAMALPPCHMVYQFHVGRGRLSCALFQRSADIFLGVPFNLFGAALITHMIAQQTDLKPGVLTWFGGDVHLYLTAEAQAREQLLREPRKAPHLVLARRPRSIDDYRPDDISVVDYDPWPALKAEVAV